MLNANNHNNQRYNIENFKDDIRRSVRKKLYFFNSQFETRGEFKILGKYSTIPMLYEQEGLETFRAIKEKILSNEEASKVFIAYRNNITLNTLSVKDLIRFYKKNLYKFTKQIFKILDKDFDLQNKFDKDLIKKSNFKKEFKKKIFLSLVDDDKIIKSIRNGRTSIKIRKTLMYIFFISTIFILFNLNKTVEFKKFEDKNVINLQ